MVQLTALLAEDDPNWAALGIKALTQAGFEVERVPDSQEAFYSLRSFDPHSIVISDLHMGGYDGDRILKDMMELELDAPFVLASGTLADAAKKTLAEGIPSVSLISKEDYLNPELLETKLKAILANPTPHRATPEYLAALKKAKEQIDGIPDILVDASRIKGRVFKLLDYFGSEFGDDYGLLKTFDYQTADTAVKLHDLKNMLSGMAANRYDLTPIGVELTRIADDIVQILNSPQEESMNLGELVSRSTSNFHHIYDNLNIEIEIPPEIRVKNPLIYSKVFYSLIENAIMAAEDNHVVIRYEEMTKSIYIVNQGEFPEDSLWPDGTVGDIESTKEFGTGFGTRHCDISLDSIGQKLTYFNMDGKVYAHVGLNLAEEKPHAYASGPRPKVLFLDYLDGKRLTGMEATIPLLNPNFEYIWSSDLNLNPDQLKELPLEDIFLVVMHPELAILQSSHEDLMFEPEFVERMPYARFGFATGVSEKSYREGLELRYKHTLQSMEFDGKTSPKKLGILSYVDFVLSRLPESDMLDSMIAFSYIKFQESMKK